MSKKVEIDEDDLKKVILLLSEGKKYVTVDPKDLQMINLWRVSGKLAQKLLRASSMQITEVGKRKFVKPIVDEPTTEKLPDREDSDDCEKPHKGFGRRKTRKTQP